MTHKICTIIIILLVYPGDLSNLLKVTAIKKRSQYLNSIVQLQSLRF